MMKHELQNQRVVITGGSRGLGRAVVDALQSRGARVTVIARDRSGLADLTGRGVDVRSGDATDAALMDAVVAELHPTALILNAGATPFMGTLEAQTWETFCTVWDTDVKAGLYGVQAALKSPMPPGGRVLIVSSGAATVGAPLSGSYAGAKRTLWFMAHDANAIAAERGLGLQFQVLVPLQMVGDTAIVREVVSAYARRQGISSEAYRASRYGTDYSAQQYGEHVAALLADPAYATGVAFGLKGESGISRLDPA